MYRLNTFSMCFCWNLPDQHRYVRQVEYQGPFFSYFPPFPFEQVCLSFFSSPLTSVKRFVHHCFYQSSAPLPKYSIKPEKEYSRFTFHDELIAAINGAACTQLSKEEGEQMLK